MLIYITTTQCMLPECKSGICASGWKEKSHWRKLQWWNHCGCKGSLCQRLREKHDHRKLLPVTTTASARCKGQGARCKGQDQHQRKSEQDAATNATPTTTTTDQLRISASAGGVRNAEIIATCVRAHKKGRAWKELENCVPLRKLQWLLHRTLHQHRCWSWAGRWWWWWWWLELHVVAASHSDLRWCWSWPLHLVLVVVVTGSNLQWSCFSLSRWHRLPLHTWPFHPLQLAPVVFFLPPTGADTILTLGQHALCGGGFLVVVVVVDVYVYMWRWWLYLRGGGGG